MIYVQVVRCKTLSSKDFQFVVEGYTHVYLYIKESPCSTSRNIEVVYCLIQAYSESLNFVEKSSVRYDFGEFDTFLCKLTKLLA